MNDHLRPEFLRTFRRTVKERVEQINLLWVEIESGRRDRETVADLLRHFHSLKGEAKLMGFSDLNLLAHRSEALVLFAQSQDFAVPETVGDILLAAVDAIEECALGSAAAPGTDPGLEALMSRMDAVMTADREPPKSRPNPPEEASPIRAADGPRQANVEHEEQLFAFVTEASATQCRLAHTVNALGDSLSDIHDKLTALVDMGNSSSPMSEASRSALVHLKQFEQSFGAFRDDVRDSVDGVLRLEAVTRRLRLQPVEPLLAHYARAVRDLAREQGKRCRVEVTGSSAELETPILEALAEPILHLVRNSVDHGLETPEEREHAGKAPDGQLTLSAEHVRDRVHITVSDDGRGVDREGVTRRAKACGLLDESAELLSEDAATAMLFQAGFSTRTQATDISGRGLGLHIVKQSVEQLGGTVTMTSNASAGTRFDLRVPLSVCATQVLVVGCGTERYALLSTTIDEVLSFSPADVVDVGDHQGLRYGDEVVRLASLEAIVGASPEDSPNGHEPRCAVLVRDDKRLLAVAVTEWQRTEEVMLKPLGGVLDGLELFSGGCALADGGLVFAIDTRMLFERARLRGGASAATETAAIPNAGIRVLLADDSALTRAMLARVLTTSGHSVVEAEDGEAALSKLTDGDFDLLLTDIDMPRLDGVGLLRRLRQHPTLAELPAIVLSTRGAKKDRQRAMDAGADAYLVKTEFSEAALRQALARWGGAR